VARIHEEMNADTSLNSLIEWIDEVYLIVILLSQQVFSPPVRVLQIPLKLCRFSLNPAIISGFCTAFA